MYFSLRCPVVVLVYSSASCFDICGLTACSVCSCGELLISLHCLAAYLTLACFTALVKCSALVHTSAPTRSFRAVSRERRVCVLSSLVQLRDSLFSCTCCCTSGSCCFCFTGAGQPIVLNAASYDQNLLASATADVISNLAPGFIWVSHCVLTLVHDAHPSQ